MDLDAVVSLKVATKGFLRGKKLWKLRFLGVSKTQTEEGDQKICNDFLQFDITITYSSRYFLDIGACGFIESGHQLAS